MAVSECSWVKFQEAKFETSYVQYTVYSQVLKCNVQILDVLPWCLYMMCFRISDTELYM